MSKRDDALQLRPVGDGEGLVFVTRRLVRFSHVDPAGIAYFPRIHNFIHEAFEDLWEEYIGVRYFYLIQDLREEYIGVRYFYLIQDLRVAFPMVHTEVDFKHPLRFGERPEIRVACTRLGRASLGMRYNIYVDDRLCVDARTTTACIDADKLKSQPIPQEYRTYFEKICYPELA